MNRFLPLIAIFLLHFFSLGAQPTTLIWQDFNGCALPDGWTSELSGNQNAVWRVGLPDNDDSDGSTIDGSCMLIFDDDETGENTEAWTLEVTSPVFDGTGYEHIWFTAPIHFRNYNGSATLEIQVFDGEEFKTVRSFNGATGNTGEQFSSYTDFVADLSFYAHEAMQVRFRYDDGGDWAWWAGVDNVWIGGEGDATNILLETFDDCTLENGWYSQVLNGEQDWQFGLIENENSAVSSMNGSCFAFFDDDGLGEDAPASTAILVSPIIDGTLAAQMFLDFDVIFRRYDSDAFSVGVYDVEEDELHTAELYLNNLGGPEFNQFVHQRLDITSLRRKQMRLVFLYTDGNSWGWWLGLDNIRLSGEGSLNESCELAIPIEIGGDCVMGDNSLALFDGPDSNCESNAAAGLWYEFTPVQSGIIRISSKAAFNDLIDVYTGECGNLSAIHCDNRDEHGFTGEDSYLPVTGGQIYYLRISGLNADFGRERGEFCLEVEQVQTIPEGPAYEACQLAIEMEVNGDCQTANNYWAAFPDPLPSRDILARTGIWFSFTPSTDEPLVFRTEADFSDVITAYTGDCNNLTEVAINEYGTVLRLEEITPGQTYFIQVTGIFATVEGELCAQIETLVEEVPTNNLCAQATNINLGEPCSFANNTGASFDGPTVSCDPFLDHSIWFQFTAPASGTIELQSDADFVHTLSVYAGNCNSLEEMACYQNPLYCDGPIILGSLSPGQTYFMRVSSSSTEAGFDETGNICLSLYDVVAAPEFMPLTMIVNLVCFDNGSATLDLEVSGGDGNYVFSGHDENVVLNYGEDYLAIVSDGHGCEVTVMGTVDCATNSNCNLSTSVSTSPASCSDIADGSAEVTVTGNTGELIYQWSTGDSGAMLGGLAPGEYGLTIIDSDGCETALSVDVPGPDPIDFISTEVTEAIDGEATGSISVNVTGGTAPYGYLWTNENGETVGFSSSINDLLPGDYTLMVTDVNGCQFTFPPITVELLVATIEPLAGGYIRVAPSPTKGPIQLDWKLPTDNNLQLTIATVSGRSRRLAKDLDAEMEAFSLDLGRQPAGLYYLRWSDGVQEWTKPVVVIK